MTRSHPMRTDARGNRGLTGGGLVGLIAGATVLLVLFMIWMGAVEPSEEISSNDTHKVSRGDFLISIPASGELSANNLVEIRNPLETRGMIMEIVDEGKTVRKGDLLVRFNEDSLEEKIKDVDDRLVDAQNRLITSEQDLAIAQSTMESDLEKADLGIDIAQLALKAWAEGDNIKSVKTFEIALETAKINSDRLTKRFTEAKELVDNGFISNDEYERDRIAMIEAAAKVEQTQLDLNVYKQYTSKQEEKTKISDVDQATAERARVKQRHEAALVTQNADVESARKRLANIRIELEELKEQLDLCSILAPTDGLVVYKTSLSSGRRGSDDNPPTVGTDVSPNELIILLPDTSQMIAEVKVSEALSGRIKPGQPAIVYSETYPNMPIEGSVQSVSVLAESGGWRDPNRRDYTVRIVLDVKDGMNLKPSMRCRSEIQLGRVEDAISVPIQSVFRSGPLAFVYIPEGGGWGQRAVGLGRASELAVEVTTGIEVGDTVLLREPTPSEITSRLAMDKPAGGPPADMKSGRPGGAPAGSGMPSGGGAPKQGGWSGSASSGGKGRQSASQGTGSAPGRPSGSQQGS